MPDYNNNGSPWYSQREKIKKVVIENGVTNIGSYAFSGCSSLISVTIPNSVTSIGILAFYECSGLTSIIIPNSVTSIGVSAFRGTKWYNNQPDGFVYVGSILYNYKGTMPANIVIKDGTKNIPASFFRNCSGLTSITIPNSVTSIGDDAFLGCSGLTSITIPNSVTSIGNHAFESCYKLKKITIGNSIESIGDYAFYSCYNIQSITIAAPEPPSCANTRTFKCEKGNLHDAYDVYNYATLHVPMGSKEAYSSAYEWRYFPKIKEDMEIDGKVYYAKLSVKQGTTGYTEQPVKADETYTIYIGALGDSKINAVTFNGEDVTDQVKDGYYTTPEIKAKSVLSISYEDINTTNVKEISNPDLKVTGNEDEIKITGIEQPTNVEVYTMDGKLVETRGSAYGDTNIQVKEDNLYVVKVGKRAIKIAM